MKYKLIALVLGCFTLNGAASPLTRTEQQAWLEDIDFYAQQVKTQHIQPFHTLAEADFDRRVERLKTQLQGLTQAQVETRLMAISRAIGDGHSNYFMMSGPHLHFPFRFKFFGDTLRVIDTTSAYRNLLGAQLSSINGVSVAELYTQLVATLPGVDNQYSEKASFEYYLSLHKLLLGLEIVEEEQPALFKFVIGEEESSVPVSPISMREFGKLSSAYSRTEPELTTQNIGMPGITLSLFRQHKAAYFDFRSYPKLEQIIANCEGLQATLRAAGSRVIIVDFRGNGGGNFYSGLALSACLQPLDQIDWMQGVYVLSDGETFSAAMTNTVQFRQILNATVVGTPTGGDPNQFSENSVFSLPNSGRRFSLSKRYYPFSDVQSDAVYPDIHITPSWEDYRTGKDTVLIYLLSQLSARTPLSVSIE
ncbi:MULTISPECIES: S41 family peptidase [unclassified Pseudoalteromonas]|uniref:S41 family peptidase n=1 Tax=unclassified Pseudoalteromonas TaxID=194690 RepID=UPI002098244E|nr:S41 family peptidase [Pseudoalteromonas sp. XMcav2-N]MCO7190356.1 S41 family peptidase [Pseudoalteromonas sp. XMcav2-N]